MIHCTIAHFKTTNNLNLGQLNDGGINPFSSILRFQISQKFHIGRFYCNNLYVHHCNMISHYFWRSEDGVFPKFLHLAQHWCIFSGIMQSGLEAVRDGGNHNWEMKQHWPDSGPRLGVQFLSGLMSGLGLGLG